VRGKKYKRARCARWTAETIRAARTGASVLGRTGIARRLITSIREAEIIISIREAEIIISIRRAEIIASSRETELTDDF
jgi:hypothetical protein